MACIPGVWGATVRRSPAASACGSTACRAARTPSPHPGLRRSRSPATRRVHRPGTTPCFPPTAHSAGACCRRSPQVPERWRCASLAGPDRARGWWASDGHQLRRWPRAWRGRGEDAHAMVLAVSRGVRSTRRGGGRRGCERDPARRWPRTRPRARARERAPWAAQGRRPAGAPRGRLRRTRAAAAAWTRWAGCCGVRRGRRGAARCPTGTTSRRPRRSAWPERGLPRTTGRTADRGRGRARRAQTPDRHGGVPAAESSSAPTSSRRSPWSRARITRPVATPAMDGALAPRARVDGGGRPETRRDALGNLAGRRGGRRPLVIGSHLDSVADAGRYDGVLGVLIALECAAAAASRSRSSRSPTRTGCGSAARSWAAARTSGG